MSTSDLNDYIDKALREHRPDRYAPGDAWLRGVADNIPDELLNARRAKQLYALDLVNRREGQATKSGNRLFREFRDTGQLELHWWETANEPIAYSHTAVVDGKSRKVQVRVALRAVTPEDLSLFAQCERKRADQAHDASLRAVSGAEAIAAEMEASGFETFAAWAECKSSTAEAA